MQYNHFKYFKNTFRFQKLIAKLCSIFHFIYTVMPPYPLIQYLRFTTAQKKIENWINQQFMCFKMRIKWEWTITWWNPAAQTCPVLDSSSFAPILTLPLAFFLLLAFSLFALVAAITQCLCSECHYLSIKLYCIYDFYTNIMLCIAFGIVRGFT
jgi:hypothetical protein